MIIIIIIMRLILVIIIIIVMLIIIIMIMITLQCLGVHEEHTGQVQPRAVVLHETYCLRLSMRACQPCAGGHANLLCVAQMLTPRVVVL